MRSIVEIIKSALRKQPVPNPVPTGTPDPVEARYLQMHQRMGQMGVSRRSLKNVAKPTAVRLADQARDPDSSEFLDDAMQRMDVLSDVLERIDDIDSRAKESGTFDALAVRRAKLLGDEFYELTDQRVDDWSDAVQKAGLAKGGSRSRNLRAQLGGD